LSCQSRRIGRPDSSSDAVASSSGSKVAPRARSWAPRWAIMAALSAQSRGDGMRSKMPRCSQTLASSARSARLQATPPPRLSLRASERRKLVDLGATRESQTKQLRDLVVGLARGIVARAAEPAIVADAAHTDQLAVAARDHQRHRRERRGTVLDRGRVKMRLDV